MVIVRVRALGFAIRPVASVSIAVLLNLLLPAGRAAAQTATPHASVSASSRAITAVRQQPLRFDALGSEGDGKSGFISRGSGYAMVLTPGSAVVSLANDPRPAAHEGARTTALEVRMTWPGADKSVQPVGNGLAAGVTNYLIGNDPSRWRRGVQSFGTVRYAALYPGIDLLFYGNQEQLEYDFVVAPGGDAKKIRLRFSGEDELRIDPKGNLVIRAGISEIVQRAPVVYQEHHGTRQPIAGRYVKTGRHEVRFAVADYDRANTLYIDPVLNYSSFFGGDDSNYALAVAVDSAGSAYVTGYTLSTTFPTTPGVYRTACSACAVLKEDVFVTKISATGVLMYSTYVGTNTTSEKGNGIAVDSAGNAYVAGTVSHPGSDSPETFPIVNGFTIDAVGSGPFLFKLNSTGSSILYSTLLRNGAEGTGVAIVGSTAYVTGYILPTNDSFPLWPTSGTYSGRIGPAGSFDAFVVKIDTNAIGMASLIYATLFGGSGLDYGNAIAVNPAGEAYVTGETASADFPGTAGAAQPGCGSDTLCNGGNRDAFVSKLNATGTAILYSTFAGGENEDRGNAIAIDSSGNAYVAGETFSPSFPVTVGALDTTLGSFGSDGFVFKLNSTGTSFVYSTFLGGASHDKARAIAVDGSGNAWIAGYTDSADFPVTGGAIQPVKAGTNTDAFTSKLGPTGAALVYSSFLGGDGGVTSGDRAFGLALDPAGDLWVVGQTDSADFPVKPGAMQTIHGGGGLDGFVVKIGVALSVTSVLPTSGSTTGGAVTVMGTGFMSGATVTFGGVAATAVSVVRPTAITLSAPAHAAGAVNVVVTNLDGQVGTLVGGFTYVAIPVLTFTDDPLQARSTKVKAIHLTEMRNAVNTLRNRYGLTAVSWAGGALTAGVTLVTAAQLTELRTALEQVYTAAARTVPTWHPATITVRSTVIAAVQFTELRTAIRALW